MVAGAKTPQKNTASADALASKKKPGSSVDTLTKKTATGAKTPVEATGPSDASSLKKKPKSPGAKRFVAAAAVVPKA
jgi:hypothetical protein